MNTVLVTLVAAVASGAQTLYLLTDLDRAQPFGGVGGISGGGATSRTLFDYPESTRATIMDLLWKPQYGASFQTVKVEVPADSDTTCGSEVAHRHDAADGGSCTRGYEGWFLAEAQQRRPGLTSSALQWAAPAFVGEAGVDGGKSLFTATNVDDYVVPWIRCMRTSYNVSLTYMGGGWNEKPHNNTYIKLMRARLDAAGLQSVRIAAADQCCGSNWGIAFDMAADPALAAVVDLISTHVAGSLEENTPTPATAMALGVPLWQGEEHIGLPDPDPVPVWEWAAAAATGVEISQNWVVNNMTATVYWPAAYGWSQGLAYRGKGFVAAPCPWGSAPYLVPSALWVVAHTTHFTVPGDDWLLNNTGSGHLGDGRVVTVPGAAGGWNVSYVTYVNNATKDFTLVIESFLAGGDWHSARFLGEATVTGAGTSTEATFQLGGLLLERWAGRALNVWHTNQTELFQQLADIQIAPNGTFTVVVEPGAIYTFTTVESSHPGGRAILVALGGANNMTVDDGPVDDPFPLPFADDFEGYANDTLPLYTQDMFGAFTTFQLTGLAAANSPTPLRRAHASAAVRAAVACSDAVDMAVRPSRCIAPANGTNSVLRQWTRQPPLGWGGESSNMATLLGNYTLRHVNVSVFALIETVDKEFAPPQTPYVLLGLHGGPGVPGASPPNSFYRTSPDFDFVWFDVTGHWGCQIYGSPAVCAASHALPAAFGYDAWHSISFAEAPHANGAVTLEVMFDGVLLFSVAQNTTAAQKNNGGGGYAALVTGCHRTQFDNLMIEATPQRD